MVGSGGREHALTSVLSRTADVVVTPGNAGIPESVATPVEQIAADLYVIGPEAPMVDGLADRLRAAGRLVFGPGADGARLEGSKAFMKHVLVDAGVSTARYGAFTDVEPALDFLRSLTSPWVVKTDGLAAGKGVFVTTSLIEAEDDVKAKLAGKAFGEAGRTVVIEEGFTGPELSLFAVCDGRRAVSVGSAQDFKRVGDCGTGLNTGGMGSYSPVPFVDDTLVAKVMGEIVEPTLAALQRLGIDYRGLLYAGLMLTADGPKVIEYNIRFGDPETQVIVPRLTSDLADLLARAAAGELCDALPTFSSDACVTVVCATEGYPTSARTGDRIDGLDAARAVQGVELFYAGVARSDDGALRTDGGRVVAVTGRGADVAEARWRAYEAADRLSWPGIHYRHDIAAQD